MLIKVLSKSITIFIVSIFLMLVGCVVWQVISRYLLGAPSIMTDELSRFLFMWVGLIGAAYATGLKQHLAIDLLLMKQVGKRKIILELLILVITILFTLLVLIYGGFNLVKDTYVTGQVSPSLGINMGIVYLCLPISGCIMLLYQGNDIFQKLSLLRKSEV